MDRPGAEPPNNLPISLQEQLQKAAQQVQWSQRPSNRGHHQFRRPEQRGQSLQGPAARDAYPNRGRPGPFFRPMQPSLQPPRAQQQFHNHRGQSLRGSRARPQPSLTHQERDTRPGPQLPSSLSTGPHPTTHRPLTHDETIPHSDSSAPSDSPLLTRGPYSLHQRQANAEAFPPLGSTPSASKNTSQTTSTTSYPLFQHQSSTTSRTPSQMSVDTAQAFFERAFTGAYRGNGQSLFAPHRYVPQGPGSGFMTDQNSPAPSTVLQPRLYNPGSDRRLWDPNSHSQHDAHLQCQYLAFLADRETNTEFDSKDLLEKEAFRKRLEKTVQQLIADYAKDHVTVNPKSVRLKCYGSLASGFAVPGSDMDLLLMFPKDQGPVGPIEVESRRMIEKAFLDLGYGARLLTKTRVPILRVCQTPSPELLANLKMEREKWEEETKQEERERCLLESGLDPNRLPSETTDEQSNAATVTFAELDTEPAIIPLPPSPARVHASLEYTADVGIQCDINFSNYVAIHNTALLRCYCKCDLRVRPMVLFVKGWSKTRKINTPYHGTLSSYGYVMMVLHYLINIAQPPVLPNLQHLARDEDAWNNRTDIELFEGFDVRFIKDEAVLEARVQAGQMTKNREALGSLLRGFYRYYTDNRGFHWLNDVISIRTQGGLLTKKSKDWTEAKRAGKDNSIRLRYLLAIEDPFETDHNIARTVGHSGIVAIRDEFRRAWNIVSKIKHAEGRWLWRRDDGAEGEDLFAKADDRGDLLRQDQDYHKEKMKKLREFERQQVVEAKSAQNEKSASIESADGRFPKPSRPSNPKGDGNVSGSHVSPGRPLLISLGHPVQAQTIERVKRLPRMVPQFSKERMDNGTEGGLLNVKSAWMEKRYDVSKWIESTAGADHPTKPDPGATKEAKPEMKKEVESEAETSRNASPMTTKLEQKIPSAVNHLRDPLLKSLKDLTPPKAPSTAHFEKSSPTAAAIELKTCVTIDPKNPLSAWNVNMDLGRWLIWRDRKIRAGTWQGISQSAPYGALDRQNPYDAARPLPDIEQQRRIANVRAKRNQYFDLKKIMSVDVDRGGLTEKHIADPERKDSAISMSKPIAAPFHKSKSNSQINSSKQVLPLRSVHGKTTAKAPSTSAFTLALSSNNPDVIHNSESEMGLVLQEPLIRAPDSDAHDHRHDFPVPTASDFQFDPAQLRDLGIIAKGGSGCARDAMEQQYGAYDHDGFRNVELSNEWGGGGRMGELVTDSGELPLPDVASTGPTEFVPRGDEDGLLQELPAEW